MEVNKLDQSSYTAIYEELRDALQKKSGQTLYPSDLETVLLECWSLLLDMQNYTMDVVTQRTQKEMLRFFFPSLPTLTPASGLLFAKPKRSMWLYAHHVFDQIPGLPYETIAPSFLQCNDIISIAVNHDILPFPLPYDLTLSKGDSLTLTFAHPLKIKVPFSLYFSVANQRISPDPQYPQSIVICQYDSVHGWCDVDMEDETIGFLASGCITIQPQKDQHINSSGTGYDLRFIIQDAWYDEAVVLHDILCNPVKIRQTKTMAYTYTVPQQHEILLQDALALHGHVMAFKQQGQREISVAFERKIEADGVHLSFEEAEPGEAFLLILQREDCMNHGVFVSTNGIGMQRVPLPYPTISAISFLMQQSDGWHKTFVQADGWIEEPRRYGAWMNQQEGWIQFGCGKDFLIPEPGVDNVIYAELILTEGANGNIKANQLDIPDMQQPMELSNGTNAPSLDDLLSQLREECWNASLALTKEEVCAKMRELPGNALDYVACQPYQEMHELANASGYRILIGAAKLLSKRYLDQAHRWIKTHLPAGMLCQVEAVQAVHMDVCIVLARRNQAISKDVYLVAVRSWIAALPPNGVWDGRTLQAELVQKGMLTFQDRCYFYKDEQRLERYETVTSAYLYMDHLLLRTQAEGAQSWQI